MWTETSTPLTNRALVPVLVATAGAAGAAVALVPTPHLAAFLLAPAVVVLALRAGWWRVLVSMSFVASLLRTNPAFAFFDSDLGWYAVQFVPIVLLTVGQAASLLHRRGQSGVRLTSVHWWLFLLLAVALVSATSSIVPDDTLAQATLFGLMTAFLCLTMVGRWRDETLVWGDLSTVFAMAAGAQLVGIGGRLTGSAWATGDYGRFEGLMSNANFAGMLSAVTLPLAFYVFSGAGAIRRVLTIIGALALIAALVMSGSRGALLGAVLGSVLAGLTAAHRLRSLRVAWLGSALAVLVFLFDPTVVDRLLGPFSRIAQGSDLTSGRIEIFGRVLDRWTDSPWFGTGFRSVEHYFGEGFTSHNIYISVLAELGLFGAAVFAGLLVAIWRHRARTGRRAALIGAGAAVMLVELTESSLFGFGGPTALFSWLILMAIGTLTRAAPPGPVGRSDVRDARTGTDGSGGQPVGDPAPSSRRAAAAVLDRFSA